MALLGSMTRNALVVTHEWKAGIFQEALPMCKLIFFRVSFFYFFNAYSKNLLDSLPNTSVYHPIQECMASICTFVPTQPTWSVLPLISIIWKSLQDPGHVAQSVGVSSHTPKGCRFDSRSGHILGCGLDPWLGHLWEATNQCFSHTSMFLSLSFSLSKSNLKKISSGEGLQK